jgi:trigger factor
VDLEGFKLQSIAPPDITDEDVEEEIRQFRLSHAHWEKADRPVQEGDFVRLSIEIMEDPPRVLGKDLRFEVADNHMAKWMQRLIMGKNVGDVVEGMSENETTSPSDFKPSLCKIQINAIDTASLPEMTDELVKKAGVETVDEFPSAVKQHLIRRASQSAQNEMRAQMENFLLEKYRFDIPGSFIQKKWKEIVRERLQRTKPADETPEAKKEMKEKIENEVREELQKAYRLFYLTNKIAEDNQLNVTQQELIMEAMRQSMLPPQDRVNLGGEREEVERALYVNVLSHKALDFLISKAI